MPRQKDLKRLVRARMEKTGEAYTAARAHVTTRKPVTPPPPPSTPDLATVAGRSDAVLRERTGLAWAQWVRVLDGHGAAALPHRDIVTLVRAHNDVASWWAQGVAVGYERIKGLRAIGQRRNGTFEMTRSRTYDVPVDVLFRAWADARTRKRWLTEGTVKIRTSTAPKSMRLDWSGGGIIAVGFLPKGKAKSAVAMSIAGLADRDAADRLKALWSGQLDALAGVLAPR